MPKYLDWEPVPHPIRPRRDKIIGPAFDTHAAILFLSPPMPRHHHAWLAACHAATGDAGAAASQTAQVLKLAPDFTIAAHMATMHHRHAADQDHHREMLLKAGLPG